MNVSNGILYTIAGVAGGGGLGYAYWKFVGCRSGMCPLTSTRLGSIIYGAVIGLMIASSAGCSSGTTTGNGNTPQQTSPAAEVHNISTAEFSEKMEEKMWWYWMYVLPASITEGTFLKL